MSEKVSLKAMRCPTCGATLKAENNTDAIVCVYCGNTIVPVTEGANVPQQRESVGEVGILKVEGIKTPASTLAYMELFFEEYDWDAFAYAQNLSIAEIDKLANSLKTTSADDKNTWFVCFDAVAVPFLKKIDGCTKLLNSVIDDYKNDNPDAYGKFDAYKRISTMISLSRDNVIAKLDKIITNAARYGASSSEVNGLKSKLDNLKSCSTSSTFQNVDSIPEIRKFIEEKNARIASQLANEGISAENEYLMARSLMDEKKYVDALNVLRSLRGYSDSVALIEEIDKYYLIYDVLEIEGSLYYFSKETPESTTLNLYPVVDSKISRKAVIKGISQIVTNYANILYYLDGSNHLRKFNLSEDKKDEKIYNRALSANPIFVYNRRVFMISGNGGDDFSNTNRTVVELDLATGTVKPFLDNIKEMVSITGNKMIYTALKKVTDIKGKTEDKIFTYIINVDTTDLVELDTTNITIEGFVTNGVVYTQEAPNPFNKSLYVKSFNSFEPETLIERNIYKFCDIIAGKLFYFIGNSKNQTLININYNGTGRKEWPLYTSKLLFEQGGWLYFIRKAGYNAILCRSLVDGSKFSVIATEIDKFIEIKNGYLYYINDDSSLMKVRMDGSGKQELCDDVEDVLTVKEDKIVFVSVDDRIKTTELMQETTKTVKSIYAVDFTGSGKIKLVYDIKTAKKHDDDSVYFISEEEIETEPNAPKQYLDVLYSLNVETNKIEKIIELKIEKKKKLSAFAVAMIITALALAAGGVGYALDMPTLQMIGFGAAGASFLIGLIAKIAKK